LSAQHPIKAKPVKTGDAKLWVYRRESGHDCQAAEDHNEKICGCSAWLMKSGIFYRMAKSNHANPKRIGNAKKKEISHVPKPQSPIDRCVRHCHRRQRLRFCCREYRS
jgi:hypothetical protein